LKKTKWLILILALMLLPSIGNAEAVYPSYTYNEWDESVSTPQGYTVEAVIRGAQAEGGAWKQAQDLCVTPQGHILLADSGNDRILEYDGQWHLLREITQATLENGEALPLAGPNGLHVSQDGTLYVALKKSAQAFVADLETMQVSLLIENPRNPLLGDDFTFSPAKIGADNAGRIYILSTGCYSGFLQFSPQGEFMGYYGANKVAVTPEVLFNYYWKSIMTNEQRQNMTSILPVEYSNLYCAPDGFVYATTVATSSPVNQVKRLNPLGNNTYLARGDKEINFGDEELAVTSQGAASSTLLPTFVDAVVTADSEFVFAVDRSYGRVFERDRTGNLIAVFGALGTQEGTFRQPVALDLLDGKVLVLDTAKNNVTVFAPTAYANLVHQAVSLYNAGEYEASRSVWNDVLKHNSNATQAYAGVGRALLKENQHEEALQYFKLGDSREEYSQTYRIVRLNRLREGAVGAVCIVAALVIVVKLISFIKKKRKKDEDEVQDKWLTRLLKRLGVPTHTVFPKAIFHPFLGFQEIRFGEEKTSLWAAIVIAVLYVLATIYQYVGTGYLFNENNIADINLWLLLAKSLGVLVIFCAAQWSVSILINTSGRLSDIVITACYALAPYTAAIFIGTWLSNYMLLDELYASYIITLGMLWGVVILLIGTITCHELSFGKTIGFLLLTIAGMAVIVFVGVLFYTLLEQLITFFSTLYVEVVFRM
jgi:tetratricopeptide (TPR) repeat protein